MLFSGFYTLYLDAVVRQLLLMEQFFVAFNLYLFFTHYFKRYHAKRNFIERQIVLL